jgi:hypothetical protein
MYQYEIIRTATFACGTYCFSGVKLFELFPWKQSFIPEKTINSTHRSAILAEI